MAHQPTNSGAPLLEQITQNPLLVAPDAESLFTQSIRHIVSHEHASDILAATMNEDEDFWPAANDWRAVYRPYNVKNGILQIPIMGVLLNRFPFQFGRWATGYAYIEKALARGLADGNVRGIALVCDSPGGEVAGNFELADKIYEARSEKPIRAFSADSAYSAAYSLASSAQSISVTRSGGVGSIGVVTAHVDYSEALKENGIKITFIFAGKHKVDGNPYEKLSKDVQARIQSKIDRIYGVFTSTVARNRAIDESSVRATEALTYDAQDAIDVKLADRIGALEEEMVIFGQDIDTGDFEMAVDTTDKGIPQATHEKAVADARAEGVTAGKLEGATAERTRISAILASDEGKKRPKAAMSLAMKTALSVEEVSATLSDMPEEKAEAKTETKTEPRASDDNPFKKHMDANGGTGVETGGDDDGEPEAVSKGQSILASYGNATGRSRKAA